MLGIQLSNSSYNLLGYEGQIAKLLCKKFALCSDSYKIVFQCWGCCYESEKILNLTSLTTFNGKAESVLRLISESVLRLFRVMESMEIGDKRRRTSVLLYIKKRIGHGE